MDNKSIQVDEYTEFIKLVRISRKEHLAQLNARLESLPKWRIFKRSNLKQIIRVLSTPPKKEETHNEADTAY